MTQFDPCHICATPAQHHICEPCVDHLANQLLHLGGHIHDLGTIVLAKQTHYQNSDRIHRHKPESSIPISLAASDQLALIRTSLTTAAKLLDPTGPTSRTSTLGMLYLSTIGHLERLQTAAWGPDVYSTLERLCASTAALVDKPKQLVFIGPCTSCKHDVRVDEDQIIGDYVTCEQCGTSFDYRQLREARLQKAESEMWTLLELERLSLQLFGRKLYRKSVWRWIKQGRIKTVGVGEQLRVRVGDVAAMIDGQAKPSRTKKAS